MGLDTPLERLCALGVGYRKGRLPYNLRESGKAVPGVTNGRLLNLVQAGLRKPGVLCGI